MRNEGLWITGKKRGEEESFESRVSGFELGGRQLRKVLSYEFWVLS